MLNQDIEPILAAVSDFDIPALRHLVAAGADINARDEFGEPFLFNAVFATSHCDETSKADGRRYDVIAALIDLGADPCQLADNGASILIGPIFSQDAAMVALLLARGVDPNHGCGEPWETVYDAAFFDFCFEAWLQFSDPLPEPFDSIDMEDEDELLRYLDHEAKANERLRPNLLFLLRKHGALARTEMALKLGGTGQERVEWRDDGWYLAGSIVPSNQAG